MWQKLNEQIVREMVSFLKTVWSWGAVWMCNIRQDARRSYRRSEKLRYFL